MAAMKEWIHENVRHTIEYVTPEIARRWLEDSNNNNRTRRPSVVKQYAHDMSKDAFPYVPVAIMFGEDGTLGNGQHRLMAIIESGKAQWLLIARGCTKEQISNADVGLKRSLQDQAHFLEVELSGK